MAEIVDLAIERGCRLGREKAHEPNLGPAQVVLYTGIRYEHPEPDSPPDRPKKRKPRNKNA